MVKLDDETKARIRAEEEERAKVRAELASQPTPEPMRSGRLAKSTPQETQRAVGGLITLAILGGIWWWVAQPHGIDTTGVQVTYAVSSNCPVDVTYTVNGADTQQEQGVRSGWTKTVEQSSLTNQLLAQLQCAGGTVTATITSPGQQPKSVTSTGDYTIASVMYP